MFQKENDSHLFFPCMQRNQYTFIKSIFILIEKYNGIDVTEKINSLKEEIKSIFPQTNTPFFIKYANQLNIPIIEFMGDSIQYGHGYNSFWLDSSFTENTSVLSIKLARNKLQTLSLLKESGIPTTPYRYLNNKEVALEFVEKEGYPVVIKPVDLDGGLGVFTEILNEKDLFESFNEAKKFSSNIMIEKHFYGKDYRLNVFNGKCIFAVERQPGGVVGDGYSSIKELIEELNLDERRGVSLFKLEIDEEALFMISKQGYSLYSIPKKNVFVSLRRKANIKSGGMPIDVFHSIHPDNADLAVRATEALRLDLSGVDLLIPDISISWRESGAIICEVNAQPDIGSITSSHLYPMILKELVPNKGRIPIVLILDNIDIPEKGGYISPSLDVFLDGVFLSKANSLFHASRILLLNKKTESLIIHLTDFSLLKSGFNFDKFDAVFCSSKIPEKDFNYLSFCLDGPILKDISILSSVLKDIKNKYLSN